MGLFHLRSNKWEAGSQKVPRQTCEENGRKMPESSQGSQQNGGTHGRAGDAGVDGRHAADDGQREADRWK